MEQLDDATNLKINPELREQTLLSVQQSKQRIKQLLNSEESIPLWETRLELKYQKLLYKLQDVYIEINEFIEASKNYDVTEEQRQELVEQKNTLLLRESQIFMVLFLIQNRNKPNFEEAYRKSFQSLEKFKVSAKLLKERPLNFFILTDLFEMEIKYNNQYLRTIRALHPAAQKSQKDFRNALKKCRVMISKINTMIYGFTSACLFPLDDLFSQPRTSPRWEALKQVMKILVLADKQRLKESFDSVRNKLVFTCAALNKYKVMKQNIGVRSIFRGVYDILKYAMSPQKAKWRAQLCIANPDGRFMKQMWNLPQKTYFRPFVDIIMPRIKYSETIYVNRVVSPISLDRVYRWEQNKDFGISDQYQEEFVQMPENPVQSGHQIFVAPPEDDISNQKIPIRINSPIPLKYKNQQPSFFSRLFGGSKGNIQTIVFHIHGGGFISMSPYIHQAYVRKWANNLNVPVFSVDYRKSPEYAFPEGLDDCFQTYVWMIKYLQKIFDLTLKKIIIIGDSAGANLGMVLINLCIRFQIRVPDGLFLIYPALNLQDNKYTPSIMSALEDLVLPHTFLKICQKSYIQDERLNPSIDPFISPLTTSEEFLKVYPPVRIYVGNMDPFHDDCCRLTERLLTLKKDVQLVVLDGFPHGFLQFDVPPEGNEFTEMANMEIQKQLKRTIQL